MRMRMIEHIELIHLLENPAARRLWLLEQALRSVPLEVAVELARTAEAFLMGSKVETVTDDPATVLRRDQDPCEGNCRRLSVSSLIAVLACWRRRFMLSKQISS